VPAPRTNTITPRRAIKNYQLNSLINLRYVALYLDLTALGRQEEVGWVESWRGGSGWL